MKLNYDKVETKRITLEVPDHYSSDDSRRGQIVDIILCDGYRDKHGVRDDLFAASEHAIQSAVDRLSRAYAMADQIEKLFTDAMTEEDVAHGRHPSEAT